LIWGTGTDATETSNITLQGEQ